MDNDNSLISAPRLKEHYATSVSPAYLSYDADLVAAFRDLGAAPETVPQKNLALTAATMTYSLEAAVFLPMALQQLKHWQRWASKGNFNCRST